MRLVLACLALLSAFPVNAEVYHWVDDKGAVNIMSKPPAGRTVDGTAIGQRTYAPEPAAPGPVPASNAKATASAGPIAAKAQVTMYMASWCGYCKQAKALLTARGVAYREVDIDSSTAANREFRSFGGRTVPLIFVGKERINGYTKESLEALLRRGGY